MLLLLLLLLLQLGRRREEKKTFVLSHEKMESNINALSTFEMRKDRTMHKHIDVGVLR